MFGGLLKIISDGFVENGMTRVHKVGENFLQSFYVRRKKNFLQSRVHKVDENFLQSF